MQSECEKPYELTSHQMVGLALMAETAYLSIAADTFIFLLILYNLQRHNYRLRPIFQSPMDIYVFSLIISDLFQGLGSALIVRWVQLGYVHCGKFCTIQGTFQTLGETSSAMNTLVIAIHTFWVITFRRSPIAKGLRVPLLVITFIWSYVIMFIVIVASERGNWNVPDPYWCWIGHGHLAAQLAGEYLWLWIAALASIILYVPLFFILKGWIGGRRGREQERIESTEEADTPVTDHESGLPHSHLNNLSDIENTLDRSNPQFVSVAPPTPRLESDPQHSHISSMIEESPESDSNIHIPTNYGLRFLLYPIAYTALVLPLSIARWSSGFSTTSNASHAEDRTTFTASSIYTLSGFVNAFLVLFTRRGVSLLSPPQIEVNGDENVMNIGTRVNGIPTPSSRPSIGEDERRDFGTNDNGGETSSIHSHSHTQIQSHPRSGTSNNGRREESAATAPASRTAVASTSSRQEDVQRNRFRRKDPQNTSNDPDQIDLRIRTIKVKGEVSLPD